MIGEGMSQLEEARSRICDLIAAQKLIVDLAVMHLAKHSEMLEAEERETANVLWVLMRGVASR